MTCESCGTDDDKKLTHSSVIASSRLSTLPAPALAWLEATYGKVPSVLCTECFIPCLTNANQAWAIAQQAPV